MTQAKRELTTVERELLDTALPPTPLEALEERVTRLERAIWGEDVPADAAPEDDPVAAAFVRFRRRMERGAA